MELGPLKAEQAIADTRRLIREGFIVITLEGAELESVWNFLFDTMKESVSFMRCIEEMAAHFPGRRVTEGVIESIARNYDTVRYTFRTPDEARRCRSWGPAG
jgi:hypothetical protein